MILESFSCGTPIVGFKIGGLPDMIKDDYNGFIFERFDIEQLKNSLSKLRENPAYYRKNARKVVKEKYSMDGMIRAIEELYIESLS